MRDIKFRVYQKDIGVMHEHFVIGGPCQSENDLFVLMQYTGLKDKNGKEIYEGDIIITDISKTRFIIDYGKKVKTTYGHGDSFTETFAGFSFWEYGGSEGQVEIIGNIYEHKHLLEKLTD